MIQFSRIANCFYLVNAILQSIPSITTNDPLATIIPLAYVVLLGIIKEFIADYKRYQSDQSENRYPAQRVRLVADGGLVEENIFS